MTVMNSRHGLVYIYCRQAMTVTNEQQTGLVYIYCRQAMTVTDRAGVHLLQAGYDSNEQ